jgi:3-hydroxyacyl-[acyl-carrier-protein] dehydratase
MLNNSLFTITAITTQDEVVEAAIMLKADSEIFNGHFPGQPVLPGACMLQIVKEVLQQALSQQFMLKKATSIKFLMQIDPAVINVLRMNMSYKTIRELIAITATMMTGDSPCLKLKATFVKLT